VKVASDRVNAGPRFYKRIEINLIPGMARLGLRFPMRPAFIMTIHRGLE
jgi:hypothetical protein